MSKTEALIEIVKKYVHDEYKTIRKKDKIWDEIGKELNENGDDIKKKWKNLRDTYAKYVRSTKTKTGQAVNNMKKSLWAEHMTAFRPYLTFAQTSSNISDIYTTNIILEETELESMAESENFDKSNSEYLDSVPTEKETYTQETNKQVLNVTRSFLTVSNTTPTTSTANNTTGRKRKNSTPVSSVGEMVKYFENKKKIEYDATDCLLLAHAKTIKTFSGRRQALTKLKIAEVMMEQELLHHEELNTNMLPRPESGNSSLYSTSSGFAQDCNNYTALANVFQQSQGISKFVTSFNPLNDSYM